MMSFLGLLAFIGLVIVLPFTLFVLFYFITLKVVGGAVVNVVKKLKEEVPSKPSTVTPVSNPSSRKEELMNMSLKSNPKAKVAN